MNLIGKRAKYDLRLAQRDASKHSSEYEQFGINSMKMGAYGMRINLRDLILYSKWSKGIKSCYQCERGVAAVEFALLAPILILILIATIELASVISSRMAINSSISSVTNSALLSGNTLHDESAILNYAQQIKKQRFAAEVSINFNQAYFSTINDAGTSSNEGASSELCYCPNRLVNQIDWGGEVECNFECADKTRAGRFMSIHVKFAPPILFGRLLENSFLGNINAVVRID